MASHTTKENIKDPETDQPRDQGAASKQKKAQEPDGSLGAPGEKLSEEENARRLRGEQPKNGPLNKRVDGNQVGDVETELDGEGNPVNQNQPNEGASTEGAESGEGQPAEGEATEQETEKRRSRR